MAGAGSCRCAAVPLLFKGSCTCLQFALRFMCQLHTCLVPFCTGATSMASSSISASTVGGKKRTKKPGKVRRSRNTAVRL